ncbi:MAG: 3-hydroxyacyl-CoA dehydrogenase NAD-binding domain-containing protein [Pseudomonadota bacterium]
MITYTVESDGILTLCWDMADRSMNVINDSSVAAFCECVDRLIEDPAVKGVVLTSAKDDFLAGGDLDVIYAASYGEPQSFYDSTNRFRVALRRLETCGKPVVAALNGTAMGGGLEIALACHYRIAAENPRSRFGLPEVKLGLLPGGGGTQRLPRLIGLQAALELMTTGRSLSAESALTKGIIDRLVPAAILLETAKEWLRETGKAEQPWDRKGYKIPGGGPVTPRNMMVMGGSVAMARSKVHETMPALGHILSCVYEGLIVDIDTGLEIEAQYFVHLVTGGKKIARNLIRTGFLNVGRANKLARRPEGYPINSFKKVGVIGAGMMGAGVAYRAAMAGIDIALLDLDLATAEKGKAYSRRILDKSVSRGKVSEHDAQNILSRIHPSDSYNDLADVDLVIEAVFEDRSIKKAVIEQAETVIPENAIIASNTSRLPITKLSEYSVHPGRFIGMHYFSPVERMPLVEVILGEKTSEATLSKAMDFVRVTQMTPIIVNDSSGFYTSRVFGKYNLEALAMLEEGVAPAIIEQAARMSGMPMPPLALLDEVSIELVCHAISQERKLLGEKYEISPGEEVAFWMVEQGRFGRKSGKGFYDYDPDNGKRLLLWPGLASKFVSADVQPLTDELIDRFLIVQAFEAVRCIEEGVITDYPDTDVGALLGWGFAPWTGGPLSYLDMLGADVAVRRGVELSEAVPDGARFSPPKLLTDMSDESKSFYEAP